MRCDIHWKHGARSKTAEVYACERASMTLDRVAARIRSVSLRFEDLNGPRGGVDKRCTVEAIGEFGSLVASAKSRNYYAAADRALGKLERGVVRALDRAPHNDH
jgi:putative sigma-54 modulation protein